jgi:hypothetical protein
MQKFRDNPLWTALQGLELPGSATWQKGVARTYGFFRDALPSL